MKEKYTTSFLLFIGLTVGTFFFIFRSMPVSAIFSGIKSADESFLLFGIFLMFCYELCEALNIYFLTRRMGERTRFFKCIGYAFVGFYFSAITPSSSGGQPAQIYFMKQDDIDIPHSTAAFILIALIFQIVTILLGSIIFIWNPPLLAQCSKGMKLLFVVGFLWNALVMAMMYLLLFCPVIIKKSLEFLISAVKALGFSVNGEKWHKNLDRSISEYKQAVHVIRKSPGLVFMVFIITVVQRVTSMAIPYVVYLSLGLTRFGALDLMTVSVIHFLASSAIPLPGNIGVSEKSFLGIFLAVYQSAGLLNLAMVLSRSISFYSIVLISGVITLRLSMRLKKKEMRLAKRKLAGPERY